MSSLHIPVSSLDFRYKQELRKERGKDTLISEEDLLGDLYNVYYNNKDLKLLLDLLAESSGVATSLRVLALFDKNLRFKSEPSNLKVSTVSFHDAIEDSEEKEDENKHQVYDVDVEFEEARAVKELFSKIKSWRGKQSASWVYTVEIAPPTKRSSIKHVRSGQSYADIVAGRYGGNDAGIEMQPLTTIQNVSPEHKAKESRMKVALFDLEPTKEYVIRVCTIVNGKTISRRTEKIKPKILQ